MENQIKKCEICKENALFLCFQCNNYYCERCYKFVHDIKINSQHIKEKIDPYVPIDIKCLNILTIKFIYFVLIKRVRLK